MQCRVVIPSDVLGQPVRRNYHPTLHNIAEECRSHHPTIDDAQSELLYLMTGVSSNQTSE